jgi:hypothetical protein
MNWGVVPMQFHGIGTDDDKIAHCIAVAKHRDIVNEGDIESLPAVRHRLLAVAS